jgi:5-formyltetrahydrofolate cyclo-ligase
VGAVTGGDRDHNVDTATKSDLRRRMRLTRDLIDDRVLRSVVLWSQLAELPQYRDATTVMAFVGGKGEPDTESLFARVAAESKTLVLPSVEGGRVVPRLVGAGLVPGAFSVPEPQGEPISPIGLDLVIVPGLAFTRDGRRLGQGGGHYDRLLAELPASCPTVGVCFAEQIVDDLPEEPHDRKVGLVLSDDLPE